MSQKLTSATWTQLVNRIDTVLLDCDGVLWHGNTVINRSTEAVARLKSLGKRVLLVTNNSARSRSSYIEKCKKLGFNVTAEEDVVTTSYILSDYMKNVMKFKGKAYVVGSRGIGHELDLVGIPHIGIGVDHFGTYTDSETLSELTLEPNVSAVVVGFDGLFSYPKLMKAASYLKDPNCLFVATNDDETFPSSNSNLTCPGTGCIVNAVSMAANRQPEVLGKPNKPMFEFIRRRFNIDPAKTLMVGDRLRTDIQFACKNGMASLLVLTGESSLADLRKDEFASMIPDFHTNSLDDILTL